MKQENIILSDSKLVATKVFQLSIFIALAVVVPYLGNQLLTGSIVNALLFISVSVLGLESAFLLCLIPSLISIYTGLLPLALAPMIPFIMTGNALLVLTFYYLNKRNFWVGAVPAILVKYIFILLVGILLAGSVLNGIASKVMLMISWPQLATAVAGASIAYLVLKIIKK
ncbi:MAG: iron hydrogenase [Candidatus Staskawiczbacteria bacterium]